MKESLLDKMQAARRAQYDKNGNVLYLAVHWSDIVRIVEQHEADQKRIKEQDRLLRKWGTGYECRTGKESPEIRSVSSPSHHSTLDYPPRVG